MFKKAKSTTKLDVKATKPVVIEEKVKPTFPVRYIIQRFDLDNPTQPTCYIIGFKLVCDMNRRYQYLETQVDYNNCSNKSDNEICVMAYRQIEDRIKVVEEDLRSNQSIMGSQFIPAVT